MKTSGIKVTRGQNYCYSGKEAADKNDPAFYSDGSKHNFIISFIVEGYGKLCNYDVYCDGEMRVVNKKTGTEYYTANDFLDYDIDTDTKLRELEDDLEWVNNSWFDIYDADTGDHIDQVFHDLSEAEGIVLELFVYQYGDEFTTENINCFCGCGKE